MNGDTGLTGKVEHIVLGCAEFEMVVAYKRSEDGV
jgi:hypothetical protein